MASAVYRSMDPKGFVSAKSQMFCKGLLYSDTVLNSQHLTDFQPGSVSANFIWTKPGFAVNQLIGLKHYSLQRGRPKRPVGFPFPNGTLFLANSDLEVNFLNLNQ